MAQYKVNLIVRHTLRILPFRLSFGSTAKSISQRRKILPKTIIVVKGQVRKELDSLFLHNILSLVVDLCNGCIRWMRDCYFSGATLWLPKRQNKNSEVKTKCKK